MTLHVRDLQDNRFQLKLNKAKVQIIKPKILVARKEENCYVFVSRVIGRKGQLLSYLMNKKVLLRERKRHTARRVGSTPSAVLSLGGGTQSLGGRGGTISLAGGYSIPGKDMGPVEVLWDGDGVPPMWTDNQNWNYYLPPSFGCGR